MCENSLELLRKLKLKMQSESLPISHFDFGIGLVFPGFDLLAYKVFCTQIKSFECLSVTIQP